MCATICSVRDGSAVPERGVEVSRQPINSRPSRNPAKRQLRVAGLFAGVGGIELGLARAGHSTTFLCDDDPACQAVLRSRFPDVALFGDVREVRHLGSGVDLVAAGFPCQDLSQAGPTAGISGARSGLVSEVLRVLAPEPGPDWLLLENVPFMLRLARGRAMTFLTDELTRLGYRWAYRVVDVRAFGLPQRRLRVILLASRRYDPRPYLLGQDAAPPEANNRPDAACGFYWTEGLRGLGWAVDAVPTLKGGSTIGIASPPAVWMPSGDIVTPDIRDAERLQGFPADWTEPALGVHGRRGWRLKLIGNAVNVRLSEWLGERLGSELAWSAETPGIPLDPVDRWPAAAWAAADGTPMRHEASFWPVTAPYEHLAEFLKYPQQPLSERATAGFLGRAGQKRLRFDANFLEDMRRHRQRMHGKRQAA